MPRLATPLLVLVLAASACTEAPTPGDLTPEQTPVPTVGLAPLQTETPRLPLPHATEPPCEAKLTESALWVHDQRLPLEPKEAEAVVTFGLDDERVLVALREHRDKLAGVAHRGALWRVTCDGSEKPTLFYQRAGADFGHAALSRDGQSLIFSGAHGLERLFLANKTVQTVTQAPLVDDMCWTKGEEAFDQTMRDRVLRVDLSTGEIFFVRGAVCGVGGVWTGHEGSVPGQAGPEGPAIRSRRPITTAAVDQAGSLWVGDGGRCDEPGVRDVQSPGHLFHSNDGGETWEARTIRVGVGRMHTAAADIQADRRRPAHLIVHSARCTSPLGVYGGRLFLTRDGGTTWKRLSVPSQAGPPTDGGRSVASFRLIGGSVDRLWVKNAQGDTFQTHNTGAKWTQLSDPKEALDLPAPTLDGATYHPSADGLQRHDVDGTRTALFPPQLEPWQ